MHIHNLYDNPAIETPCFLFVQLQAVNVQPHKRAEVSILNFRVEPVTTELGGSHLYSNLYQTPEAEKMWIPCRQAFEFTHYDAHTSIDRWGKIYLVPSRWEDHAFSTIQYIGQTAFDRQKITELDHLTRINGIPWAAEDVDESIEHVDEAIAQARLVENDLF